MSRGISSANLTLILKRSGCDNVDFMFRFLPWKLRVTAEIQKQKYIYYHCTRYKGKCALPFKREEEVSGNLGQILQDIYIPDDVLAQLQASLTEGRHRAQSAKKDQREKLQARLTQETLNTAPGEVRIEHTGKKMLLSL